MPPRPTIGEQIWPRICQIFSLNEITDPGHSAQPFLFITDDPAFADHLTSGLELRLHETDEPSAWRGVRERRRQRLGEADKADVGGDRHDRFWNESAVYLPGIDRFQGHDAGVRTQTPIEQITADVDRINSFRTAAQQDLGKAARRSPDIQRHTLFR